MSFGAGRGRGLGRAVDRPRREPQRARFSALMLDCTAGTEPGDPYAAPTPERRFVEALARPPGKLRIALMLKDHRGAQLHPECEAAVRAAAKLCASLGHSVEEADPQARHGGAAADECQDRRRQHRALLRAALEGAGPRAERRRRRARAPGPPISAASRSRASSTWRRSRRCMRRGAGWRAFLGELRRDPVDGARGPAAQARLLRPERRPRRRSPSA